MITTRYGSQVKIVGYNADLAVVQCIREDDKQIRNYSVGDLRATDGAQEILAECLKTKQLSGREIAL